ncbi:MAG: hypothetical protein IJR89_06105 [Clostridia bacterium]|nr:hypothetical protein [Clostridia bacterium]
MKKSVYSLVLSDAVISQIDRAAYAMKTSRSALINQILADYVSYVTPESRVRDALDLLERSFSASDLFRIQPLASESMLTLLAPIEFKYNPTVRYCLAFYKEEEAPAELRVSARTQNPRLILLFSLFYSLWNTAEENEGGDPGVLTPDARFVKRFRPQSAFSVRDLSDALSAYVRAFDRGVRIFFSHPDDRDENAAAVRRLLAEYHTDYPVFL